MSLIFAAMAPASAPAGTVAVIQECKAKGNLTKALYAVVGFDDGLAIIIFGFAAAIAKSLLINEASGVDVSVLPGLLEALKEIGLSIAVGSAIGFVFCHLVRFVRDQRDMIVLTFAAVLIAIGCANQWHLSLILTNMVIGFILINTRKKELAEKVSSQLLIVMPLLFILFFSLAGAHLNLESLPSLGLLGLVYIVGRSVGLVGGARLGGQFGKVEDKVKKYVGMGILSQAGVAIGLALIVKHDVAEIGSAHADKICVSVITTITATCIFFELIGPILTKMALTKAGEVNTTDEHH
jgi:Kef-type K+ transport system membrane component KefB